MAAASADPAMGLVLEFLESRGFTAAETALRAQLARDAAGQGPEVDRTDVTGRPTLSQLERLIGPASPSAGDSSGSALGPTLDGLRDPGPAPLPVSPVVAQPRVAFYDPAAHRNADEWSDDEDSGYRRVPCTEESLMSGLVSPHRAAPAPPQSASAAQGTDGAEASDSGAGSRDPAFEVFPNLQARPLAERDLDMPAPRDDAADVGRAKHGGLDRPVRGGFDRPAPAPDEPPSAEAGASGAAAAHAGEAPHAENGVGEEEAGADADDEDDEAGGEGRGPAQGAPPTAAATAASTAGAAAQSPEEPAQDAQLQPAAAALAVAAQAAAEDPPRPPPGTPTPMPTPTPPPDAEAAPAAPAAPSAADRGGAAGVEGADGDADSDGEEGTEGLGEEAQEGEEGFDEGEEDDEDDDSVEAMALPSRPTAPRTQRSEDGIDLDAEDGFGGSDPGLDPDLEAEPYDEEGEEDEEEGEEVILESDPDIDPYERSAAEEAKFETLHLKVVHERARTGFEEHKDFPIRINSLIAARYQVKEYLGSAAFSKAVQCIDLHSGELVCIKIIKNNKDFFDQSLDEIKLLRYIKHHDPADTHNVLHIYDFFYHKEHLFIVCELLRDNLYEFSRYNRESGCEPYFTLPRLRRIAKQCLDALRFVHGLDLIHCDLKPENILIKSYSRCEIKVIDFGSSCFTKDHLSSYVQSRSYRAPEVILGLPYDQKIDIWSLGAILAELLTGYVLFQNDSVPSMLSRIIGILGPFPEEMLARGRHAHKYFANGAVYEREASGRVCVLQPKLSTLGHRLHTDDELFISFVGSLLRLHPDDRPTAEQALQHPFITSDAYGPPSDAPPAAQPTK